MRKGVIRRRRLALFVGILAVFGVVLAGISSLTDASAVLLAPLYMFTPAIAALAVRFREGVPLSATGVRPGRPRWLLASALVALALVVAALGLSLAVPGVSFDATADPVPGVALPSGVLGVAAVAGLVLVTGATLNALFALGEELGWRGYLLWELAPLGFWKASFAIGGLWGIWHAPVIVEGYNYPSFPLVGVLAMTAACIAFSPVYTYVVVRSKSVLAAALLHGVFNASGGLVLAYSSADGAVLEELVASPVGAAGVVAFALAAVGIATVGTPRLSRGFATADPFESADRGTTAAGD